MAEIQIQGTGIRVKLSFWEKMGALHGDLFIPVTSLRGALAVTEPKWYRTLGMRVPGSALPGVGIWGTYIWSKKRDFVVWRWGTPVLQLNLSGKPYTRVFIGVQDAAALADEINDALTAC
jgi:hypothetical protein